LVGFAAVGFWSARDAFLSSKLVTVVPVITSREEISQEGAPLFQAAGWVEPRPTPVLVTALTEGVVEQLLVVEDQPVRAGEPVARLIEADARIALRASQADLDLREAELAGAQATLATARTNFEKPVSLEAAFAEADAMLAQKQTERATLPSQLRGAEARHQLAWHTLNGALRAGGGVSQLTVHQNESERDMAVAAAEELKAKSTTIGREIAAATQRRDALRRRLELKTEESRQLGEATAAVSAAEARRQQARVALDAAKLRLERMTVRAPMAGRVLSLVARPGTRLMGLDPRALQDASTVVSLYDPDRLQVRTDVRLEDVPRVQPGQKVKIETASAPGRQLDGEVLFATPQADVQKNTLQVKVAIKDPPATVRPDMLARVTFLALPTINNPATGNPAPRILVPRSLLLTDDAGSWLWLADQAEGAARRRSVKVGTATAGELVQVIEGLSPGDRLIVNGRDGLREGDRVRVTGEDADLGVGVPSSEPKAQPRSFQRHH
jgi:RND family efflux transporter MFP subunit